MQPLFSDSVKWLRVSSIIFELLIHPLKCDCRVTGHVSPLSRSSCGILSMFHHCFFYFSSVFLKCFMYVSSVFLHISHVFYQYFCMFHVLFINIFACFINVLYMFHIHTNGLSIYYEETYMHCDFLFPNTCNLFLL